MNLIDRIDQSFTNTDLQYDNNWLHKHHYIVTLNRQYNDDIYRECNILIDMFCLQKMKETAYMLSENTENDIWDSARCYLYVIRQLKIDFNLFTLLAGESYITSDQYSNELEDDEENQLNILIYLINKNYYQVVGILNKYYENEQAFLLTILEPFSIYEEYQKAVAEICTLEDMFDYPEVVRLHEWARSGFDINGEQ